MTFRVSPQLENLVAASASCDLEFESEEIRGHSQLDDKRTGFKLVRVAGTDLPAEIRLAFVVGKRGVEEYFYVVLWPSMDAPEPEVRDVPSVDRAREEILNALKAQVTRRA